MNLEPITRILLLIVVHMAASVDLEAILPTNSNVSFEMEAKDQAAASADLEAVVGRHALLPCNTSLWGQEEAALVLWYKSSSGKPIYTLDARNVSTLARGSHLVAKEFEGRAVFDITTSPPSLRMTSISVQDEDEYRCRCDYRMSRTQNFLLNLTVVVSPERIAIKVEDEDHGLVDLGQVGTVGPLDEGSNIVLVCQSTGGKPLPSLIWYLENQIIDDQYSTGTSSRMVLNELRLENVTRKDLLKKLACRASNSQLLAPFEASVIVDMNLAPVDVKIIQPKKPLSAGHRVELVCKVIGSRPMPEITWLKDDVAFLPSPTSVRQTLSHDGNITLSSLTFVASAEDNGRTMACRAENNALSKGVQVLQDSRQLTVHYVPQVRIALGAKIDGNSIREGTDVYFECIVEANPWVSEVTWLFEGNALFSDPSSGIIISNQSLVLQRVKRQSRGRYWCVALNPEGQGESEELYLKVQSGQRVTYGVARNELVQVSCEVDADPSDISFRWLLNNSDVHTEVRSYVSNGSRSVASYIPTSLRTYGRMLCWGENAIGQQRDPCVFHIIPASPPEAVHNCSVRNQSFNSLLVACEPGENGGLRQVFFLEVYNTEVQRLHSNITSVDIPEFLVHHLPPGAKFTLNVYAANSKGRSSSTVLAASTLSLPQKQTHKVHTDQPEPSIVTPIVGILIGIVATLSLLSVLLVVCLKLKSNGQLSQLQGQYKEQAQPDVTYAELTLASSVMGIARKSQQHVTLTSTEYAQLDFEHSRFRTLLLDVDQGLRGRSPVADGCSETEVSIEAPLIESLKPANYHAHDIIIRRLSPSHHRTATPV
ncbi:Nephrin [Halotydeus destructor]|nr:Nephrin [Halotydeus destructor]